MNGAIKLDKIKVVIPASGSGQRFGGDVPKQFLEMGGEPILKYTLSIFDELDIVDEIAVTVPAGYSGHVESYGIKKLRHIVAGKENRAASIYEALKCYATTNPDSIILIHDGIRPLVTGELIRNVAAASRKYGAAIACTPVTDTIKEVGESGKIISTPDRRTLWRAQTPQGFTYGVIKRAYDLAEADDCLGQATDDSVLVERLGIPVYIVRGSETNIKITTPSDLQIATAFQERL